MPANQAKGTAGKGTNGNGNRREEMKERRGIAGKEAERKRKKEGGRDGHEIKCLYPLFNSLWVKLGTEQYVQQGDTPLMCPKQFDCKVPLTKVRSSHVTFAFSLNLFST